MVFECFEPTEGKKFDDGKQRWDLLPYDCIEEIVKIYTFGAKKYGDNQWQQVKSDRYFAALMRHLIAWRSGESRDSESGLFHLAHAAWNCIALLWSEKHGK